MSAVYESMTKIQVETGFTVRVWRLAESLEAAMSADRNDIVDAAKANCASPIAIINAVSALPNVSDVEVLDRFGNGIIYYPEWP